MKYDKLKSHIHQSFFSEKERDLRIIIIGYDDFKEVKPYKIPHICTRNTLHYVFRGSGKLFVDGVMHEVCAKQFFFVPKGISTYYYPNDGDEWAYMWFTYEGELDDVCLEGGVDARSPVYSVSKSFDESALMELIRDCNVMGKTGYYKAKSAFYACVDEMVKGESFTSPVEMLVKDATAFIDMNYHDCDFSVSEISTALHVSHSYLSRVYKESTGYTLSERIKSVRLTKAGGMLLKTPFSAKEIGYSVGYRDDVHFLKEFKKFYGMTTKEYKSKKSREK